MSSECSTWGVGRLDSTGNDPDLCHHIMCEEQWLYHASYTLHLEAEAELDCVQMKSRPHITNLKRQSLVFSFAIFAS